MKQVFDNGKIETYSDCIRTVMSFLKENEQYGDDWSEEIKTLNDLLDDLLE